jgi:hypothetical protein
MNGTWADTIVVQAVSDALNCIIDITESALNFNATTIIHPVIHGAKYTKIHIGHVNELHYVSTTMCSIIHIIQDLRRDFVYHYLNLGQILVYLTLDIGVSRCGMHSAILTKDCHSLSSNENLKLILLIHTNL